MTLVIRASPSPTSLRIPPLKHNDLQRLGEGPLASPLQNLFLFNGLPCLPFFLISSSPCRLALSCLCSLCSSEGQSVGQGGSMLLAEQNGYRDKLQERKWPPAAGAGLADVGFPRSPPGFYWGKKLIKVSNPAYGKKSECSRQCWPQRGGWEIQSL